MASSDDAITIVSDTHPELVAAAIRLLPDNLPSPEKLRALPGGCERSMERALEIISALGPQVSQGIGEKFVSEIWDAMVVIPAQLVMSGAMVTALKLDLARRRMGEPSLYQTFTVFDSRDALKSVLHFAGKEVLDYTNIMRRSGPLSLQTFSEKEWITIRTFIREHMASSAAPQRGSDNSASDGVITPVNRPRLGPAGAELELDGLRKDIRQGKQLETAISEMADSIGERARAGDFSFLRRLGDTIRETEKGKIIAPGPDAGQFCELPELWLPLCLWEYSKDSKKAYSRYEQAVALPGITPLQYSQFRSAFKNAKNRGLVPS